jgi:hypothetical protein
MKTLRLRKLSDRATLRMTTTDPQQMVELLFYGSEIQFRSQQL